MPSVVRNTMAQLIDRVRLMIFDPRGATQFFADSDIQDTLDEGRDDIRYEPLAVAPTIVNTASTGNQASTIFINYFSKYQWWEQDAVLQGYSNGQAWVVVPAVQSDYITGRFWFETASTEFTAPTVPGQLPPVFITGKVFDPFYASADLLEFWAAALSAAYNISVDGQSLSRSQLMTAKLTLADQYRRRAKPRIAKMNRGDVLPELSSRKMRLLDSDDVVRGA
jgi:hypothetical protein